MNNKYLFFFKNFYLIFQWFRVQGEWRFFYLNYHCLKENIYSGQIFYIGRNKEERAITLFFLLKHCIYVIVLLISFMTCIINMNKSVVEMLLFVSKKIEKYPVLNVKIYTDYIFC